MAEDPSVKRMLCHSKKRRKRDNPDMRAQMRQFRKGSKYRAPSSVKGEVTEIQRRIAKVALIEKDIDEQASIMRSSQDRIVDCRTQIITLTKAHEQAAERLTEFCKELKRAREALSKYVNKHTTP